MAPHVTTHGKWSEPDVPHKGWTCVDVQDLGEPSMTCEMCESSDIRYVHTMEHPDYRGTLDVGCICAEHMEDDYVMPRRREGHLRQRARRQQGWQSRIWSVSRSGNWYLNTEGYNLILVPWGLTQWKVRVTHRASGHTQLGQRIYATETLARAAALDALLWAKEHL